MATATGTQIQSDDGLVVLRPSNFAPMLAAALRSGVGRVPRTFSQWIEQDVWLPDDGGPRSGYKFRFEFQPITRLWAAEIDSGRWNEMIYSGPSQSGKSLIGYVLPFVYHVAELNESIGFAVPQEEMAGDKWAADIKPVFNASYNLKKCLPKSGPGSAGGTIRDRVQFANGPIAKILTAGGSDQGKAGFTCGVLVITEAARFSRGAAKSAESTPYEQVKARMRSKKWADRKTYVEGTNTLAEELPASLWEGSSKTEILAKCPHCGAWINPGRDDLQGWQGARTEVEANERATWVCPKCGEAITTAERRAALNDCRLVHDGQTIDRAGNVSGDLPKTRRLFFRYSAWHNLFLDAGDIAVDLWAAEQLEPGSVAREQAERKLCQFVFGTVYTPPVEYGGEVLEESDFEKRRDQLGRGIAHDDTAYCVTGVDVGEHAVHWVILGVRPGSLHVIDYGVEKPARDRPMKEALHDALGELFGALEVGLVRQNGQRLPMQSVYVDSGHLPEVVMSACKAANDRIGRAVFLPVLGRGETQMQKRRYSAPTKTGNVVKKIDPERRWHLSRVRKIRIDQLTLDADCFKRLSDSGFRTPAGEPGAITLFAAPGSVHKVFIKHQINEQYVLEELPGQPPRNKWIELGPQHFKDALAYGYCGATRLGWDPTSDPRETKPKTAKGDGYE